MIIPEYCYPIPIISAVLTVVIAESKPEISNDWKEWRIKDFLCIIILILGIPAWIALALVLVIPASIIYLFVKFGNVKIFKLLKKNPIG